jgi:hypothetical protein
MALCLSAAAQSNRPDEVSLINDIYFAYYRNTDKTMVMSKGITIFDNSQDGFHYFQGAQRVDLFLTYEFKGKSLTQMPSSISVMFESRSSAPQLTQLTSRKFALMADTRSVFSVSGSLTKSNVIGLITWENVTVEVPLSDIEKFLAATQTASLQIGSINYSFSRDEFSSFRKFVDALRIAKQ